MTILTTKANASSSNDFPALDDAQVRFATMTDTEMRYTVELLRQLLRQHELVAPAELDGEIRWKEGWVEHDDSNEHAMGELTSMREATERRLRQLTGISDPYGARVMAQALVTALDRIDARLLEFREHLTKELDKHGHDANTPIAVIDLLHTHLQLREDAYLAIRHILERARSPIVVAGGFNMELPQ